jgi:hypothetical protein
MIEVLRYITVLQRREWNFTISPQHLSLQIFCFKFAISSYLNFSHTGFTYSRLTEKLIALRWMDSAENGTFILTIHREPDL